MEKLLILQFVCNVINFALSVIKLHQTVVLALNLAFTNLFYLLTILHVRWTALPIILKIYPLILA